MFAITLHWRHLEIILTSSAASCVFLTDRLLLSLAQCLAKARLFFQCGTDTMLQSTFNHSGQRELQDVYVKRLLAAVEKEQLERLKDGHALQEEIEAAKEGQQEGLQQLDIDKHKFDSSTYRKKALVRTGLDSETYEGIGTGRLYDKDGEILSEGITRDDDHPERYQNFYQSHFFHSRQASPFVARSFMAYDMGCDMLPTAVQPFIMKRNSPMLQRAISNKNTPKHIRRFLNRNASRVDGLRSVPMRDTKTMNAEYGPRLAKSGAAPTNAILHSAVLQKSWKTASRAYSLLIRNPETLRAGLMGLGVQILAETKKPPHNLSTCTSFLGFLMLEITWQRHHNRTVNFFSRNGNDVPYLVSRSDDFLRNLTLVHLKFKGAPEELLTRLDEEMMVPPFSADHTMMYLRGIVLLRCVYHSLDEQGVLSAFSRDLLNRAKEQFETSHEKGVIFCLEEYLTLIEDILNDYPHGEVKLEAKIEDQHVTASEDEGSDDEYETVPWWEKTLDDGSQSASGSERAEGADQTEGESGGVESGGVDPGEEVPWWEKLNSDSNVEEADDDDIEVDDDSDPEVKSELEEEPGLAGSGSDASDGNCLNQDDELDIDEVHAGTDRPVKPEPNDDYDFDFGFDSDSDEAAVKTEPADIQVGGDSQSPVPQVKKEGFATLDDLLGSMPQKKSKEYKNKDKKKKKKSRKSGHDDSMDFDF